MAQYTVRLYFETGFNSINIPDSPALLNGNEATIPPTTEFSYLDFPSLDINQERFLPMVRIRASWDVIKNADYCRIGMWFYFVNGIRMSSGDVAELTLTPDFITSAGGVSQLQILDGVTDRVHITNDTYGLYGEEDPYMNPAYDMDVSSYTYQVGASGHTFVETTFNLDTMGLQHDNNTTPALTAEGTKDGETYRVTYPMVTMLGGRTNYSLSIGGSSHGLMSVQGQGVYELGSNALSDTIRAGIAQARSLGSEDAVSGQYFIPSMFIDGPQLGDDGYFQSGLVGQSGVLNPGSPNFIYGSARNNRVFYGSQTPYTLASASGDTITAKAEEVYGSGMTSPAIMFLADPRRTGKPYYRFTVMQGTSAANTPLDFFRNCVAGQQWQSVPLVMTEKSGGLLDQINHQASISRRDLAESQRYQSYLDESAVAKLSNGIGIVGDTLRGNIGGAFGRAAQAGMGDYLRDQNYERYLQSSALDRAIEEQQFGISQNVHTPTIAFPADPALFAEVTRNGFALYRAVYKSQDISRIDKILTAYGYKHTKMLEPTDFTNRRDFNYVRASISVGNIPRWWANGIAAQLSGGVRVWHRRPDPAYYTQNPVAV